MTLLLSNNFDAETVNAALPGWATANGGGMAVYNVGTTGLAAVSAPNTYGTNNDDAAVTCTTVGAITDQGIRYVLRVNSMSDFRHIFALLRWTSFTQSYAVYTESNGTGLRLNIFKYGPQSVLASSGYISAAAGDLLHLEATVVGQTIEARLWPFSGARPSTPSVTFTDAGGYTSGRVGLRKMGSFGHAIIDNLAIADGASGLDVFYPPGPTISAQPSSQTVTAPATATFSVTAAAGGGGTLGYQWQRSTNGGGSWANVTTGTGGTTSSYTTPASTVTGSNANNADQFRCVVTETGGTAPGSTNSNGATLTVNAAAAGPTINTQPSSQTVTAPGTATFTVAATASGGSLSYQWQRSINSGGSWSNVTTGTGGTSASYTTAASSVTGGSANSGDQYRCAVTDSNGTVNTSAATLTVNAAAAGLTSSPLKTNAGALHLAAPFEAFVLNVTTGAQVVRKTGLTSNAVTGVVAFTDAALASGTQYRLVWRRTDTGAQGVELLTAA